MFNKVSRNIFIIALLMIAFVVTSLLAVSAVANAEVVIADKAISDQLTPRRVEYGNANAGECFIDGNTVYKNYEYGCVTATLGANNSIMNMRSHGGVNYNEDTQTMEFLKDDSGDYKLRDMIYSRDVEPKVFAAWENLSEKFESSVQYSRQEVFDKIYNKYKELCSKGYNCGIATGELSVWDDAVIKLDFYDGDSEYGFGEKDGRVYVTTIAYSFLMDEAFAISGKFFDFYKDAKARSLSEPITDAMQYTEKGVKGTAQGFAFGYMFCPDGSNKLTVRSGMRWDPEAGKSGEFKPLPVDENEITRVDASINDVSLKDSPYYSEFTVSQIQDLFLTKYYELVDSGFNPGLPDNEGIFYWDTEYMKQAYVGSDGTGNAWGRTNMMLMLNPYSKQVYVVYGEILNAVDDASLGLGNAKSLGFPISDPKTKVVNGLKYTYQDFERPFYSDKSTIYTIEENEQLTRHIVGGYFDEVVANKTSVSANNPKYFYVLEPWAIALICLVPVVIGACVAVYFFVFKKKKKAVTETADTTETVKTTETADTTETVKTTETADTAETVKTTETADTTETVSTTETTETEGGKE